MAAKECPEPTLGQVLDPFRSGSVVKLGIMAGSMVVGHSCMISRKLSDDLHRQMMTVLREVVVWNSTLVLGWVRPHIDPT